MLYRANFLETVFLLTKLEGVLFSLMSWHKGEKREMMIQSRSRHESAAMYVAFEKK